MIQANPFNNVLSSRIFALLGYGREQFRSRTGGGSADRNTCTAFANMRVALPATGSQPRDFDMRMHAIRFPDGMRCSPGPSEMNPFAV